MDCGSCKHFYKIKNDNISGGICNYYDVRTDTDRGHGCPKYKAKKYLRYTNAKPYSSDEIQRRNLQ